MSGACVKNTAGTTCTARTVERPLIRTMSMSASASRAALIEAGRNRLSRFREEKKRSENPKLTDSALKRRVTWASDVGSTSGPLPAQPSFGTETVENEAPASVPLFKARTPTKASTTPTSASKKVSLATRYPTTGHSPAFSVPTSSNYPFAEAAGERWRYDSSICF